MDEKKYTPLEAAEILRKSLYKMVKKADKKNRERADSIVRDIEDPNYIAEVPDEDIPEEKTDVLWKYKGKGVNKLKKFKKNKVKKSKGVHQPVEGGKSKAGEATRKLTDAKQRDVKDEDWWGRAKQLTQHNQGKEEAKREHYKVMREQSKGNKPKLPR